MDIALAIAGVAIFAWLLRIVHRQDVRKQLPWFVSYVAWELVVSCIQLALLFFNRHLYFSIYWWIEGIEIALIVAAVRESLLRIFEGFASKPGFRLSVWGVILAALFYSAWKSVSAPPIQSDRLGSFILGAEFAFRWAIAGIGLLTIVLSFFIEEPKGTREDSVVTGFGVASIAFVAWVLCRSFFGTRFRLFVQYMPAVGYFLAAFLWIKVFSRPVDQFGFKKLGMGPEDIAKELRRYREFGERIMRKK